MSLSDKIAKGNFTNVQDFIRVKDVKEFLNEILESPLKEVFQIKALIKNRAGDVLVGEGVENE